jgi:hypothetical protein
MGQFILRTAAILAIALPAAAGEPGEWIDLFNGKDLSGWQANRHPESFSVTEDGELRAQGLKGLAHLLYVGNGEGDGIFKDFELNAECRGEPESNSGIFFHTNFEVRKKKYLIHGYEVQLNDTEREKRKTGGLYAIKDLDVSPVDETQWFDLTIKVEGKHIQVAINGETVLDYTEPENPERAPDRAGRVINPEGGHIALQAHDPRGVYYFKNIKIRRLNENTAN